VKEKSYVVVVGVGDTVVLSVIVGCTAVGIIKLVVGIR
jgi:hypothetical protein